MAKRAKPAKQVGKWIVTVSHGLHVILDQHAHKLLGNFPLDVAFETARAYAKEWVTQGGHAEACACVDIEPLTEAEIDEIAMRAAVDIKYPKRKRPYVRRSVRARA